jgi:peptide-methionine (R)-S-oxide reductase
MDLDDNEWKKRLTPEQYHILREQGTEIPGTGELLYNTKDGMYFCAACHAPLFKSDDKYETTVPGLIGWPSFSAAADNAALELIDDSSLGMRRVEVRCRNCGGHLGHLFDDSSSSTGEHFCINSAALNFEDKA